MLKTVSIWAVFDGKIAFHYEPSIASPPSFWILPTAECSLRCQNLQLPSVRSFVAPQHWEQN